MKLKSKEGAELRVGTKSIFEIVTQNREVQLRVSATGRGAFRTISWHYGKASAQKQLAEIQEAIRRGDKTFSI